MKIVMVKWDLAEALGQSLPSVVEREFRFCTDYSVAIHALHRKRRIVRLWSHISSSFEELRFMVSVIGRFVTMGKR